MKEEANPKPKPEEVKKDKPALKKAKKSATKSKQ